MSGKSAILNRMVTGTRQYPSCPVSSWLAQVRRVLHPSPALAAGLSPLWLPKNQPIPPAAVVSAVRSRDARRPGAVLIVANKPSRSSLMTVNVVLLQPLVALIAGILILLVPRLLNYIVAIYLIIIGLAGLLPHILR